MQFDGVGAAWVQSLVELGLAVQARLVQAHSRPGSDFAEAVAQQGGDTIYGIDRHVEPVIEDVVASWPAEFKPLMLTAEGMGHDGRKRYGPADQPIKYRVIIDPIDGTRNLMFDKRSAWFIAAVAEDHGEATNLSDIFAAVLIELPTTKQGWADTITAVRGQGTRAWRSRIDGSQSAELRLRSSEAATLRNGFGQVSSFFPGTKLLAAELMERIVASTLGAVQPGEASVFEDQYISTGGQMVELIAGRDRFCCDLRPLFFKILQRDAAAAGNRVELAEGLVCHPYDAAAALVATEAGVVITDGWGRQLKQPLDVHTPVHWCGYANESLRRSIEPVIQQWLSQRGIDPGQE